MTHALGGHPAVSAKICVARADAFAAATVALTALDMSSLKHELSCLEKCTAAVVAATANPAPATLELRITLEEAITARICRMIQEC
jgi:hypothetical protein